MYRVTIKSRGKYDNATLGTRYCLTRRSAIRLTALFVEDECDLTVEKWIRMHGDTFCWSETEVNEVFWDKVYKIVEKEQEEGA